MRVGSEKRKTKDDRSFTVDRAVEPLSQGGNRRRLCRRGAQENDTDPFFASILRDISAPRTTTVLRRLNNEEQSS
jgi:hypothetical protein